MLNFLLWTDRAKPYTDAIATAGLDDRVKVTLADKDNPPGAETLAATEAMFAMGCPPGTLSKMPKLRWVQALTAGVESWLARSDLREEIRLSCARGTHRIQMPENILGAMFHITKPYAAILEDDREHRWVRRVSDRLAGKTLGVLGLGAIGQELARKAAALEMRVIGTRRNPGPVPHVEQVYGPEQTDEVLAQSDFVVLLLPVTPQTENLIDAGRLAKMKPGAWLLNFGRGHLIVDADLIAAVERKQIAGAILDVFRQEPLPPEHPFWSTPGIMVLPHIGGGHPGRDADVAALLVENIRRYLDGRKLKEEVERSIGY